MLSVSYNVKNINALYANRFGDRSKEKVQLLADEGKYCVLYLSLIQSITTITRTHWQANMPQRSERGSLPRGGGDSHMKQTGMLVGNFEFNP